MPDIVATLFEPIPLAFGIATSWAEIAGFLTGAWTVWLAARNNAWTWPIGIINGICWVALFASIALYADAGLQVVYIAMGLYGTWHWLRGGPAKTVLPIGRASRRELAILAVVAVAGIAVLTWGLASFTNSVTPFPDAATTVLSLVANWLLARRVVENWPVWILGVNLPYIGLYVYKGVVLTASLQLVYIALSVAGWRAWRRELAGRNPSGDGDGRPAEADGLASGAPDSSAPAAVAASQASPAEAGA